MTEVFAAFAALMSIVNLVALACIDYNLRHRYYRRSWPRDEETNALG